MTGAPYLPDRPACPHCGARPSSLAQHLVDFGPDWPYDSRFCPVLYRRRNGLPEGEWLVTPAGEIVTAA